MADTAFQTQYRDELIAGFERSTSLLTAMTTRETVIKGNSAVFDIVDSGSATATTRGVNGRIPARGDNNTQVTATLTEWHDVVEKTEFNVFASQGNQRAVMQRTTMAVINRKMDDLIIAELDTATNDTGAAATGSLAKVVHAQTILGNNNVDISDEDNLFAVVSPAFRAYLLQTAGFASGDYVDVKPMVGPARKMFRWMGFNWVVHSGLTGVGTSSEKTYFFHRNALGLAVDTKGIQSPVGYDERHAFSWARCSVVLGAKLLQNSGVVQVLHDGAAYVAT
jgi:hypothetical protein